MAGSTTTISTKTQPCLFLNEYEFRHHESVSPRIVSSVQGLCASYNLRIRLPRNLQSSLQVFLFSTSSYQGDLAKDSMSEPLILTKHNLYLVLSLEFGFCIHIVYLVEVFVVASFAPRMIFFTTKLPVRTDGFGSVPEHTVFEFV